MKLTKNIFLWAVVLAASAAAAAEQPLARLSVRSFTDLTNAVSRVASNLAPNETQDHGMEFSKSLGITNLTALDAQRPWEIALWYGEGGQLPLLAIKAPVENITQFKESLSPAGGAPGQGARVDPTGQRRGLDRVPGRRLALGSRKGRPGPMEGRSRGETGAVAGAQAQHDRLDPGKGRRRSGDWQGRNDRGLGRAEYRDRGRPQPREYSGNPGRLL